MRFPILAAVFILLLGTGQAFAQDAAAAAASSGTPAPAFYNSGLRMGTSYCSGVSFDCDTLASSQSSIVDAANQCISSRFGIEQKIMASFSAAGEFENCVLPSSAFTNVRGMREWAVCCVKKNAASGACDLECTRYIDQKADSK